MKYLLSILFCILYLQSINAQIVGADDASNYASWANMSNNGTGFTAWDLWTQNTNTSNFAGHFLGSSTPTHGDINTSGNAFGMYGNPSGSFPQANAQRGFNYSDGSGTYTNLQDDHTFSIDLAVAYRNGYKGIDIMEDDYTLAFNFNVESDEYRVNGVDLGWTYDQFSIITLEVTQKDATNALVKLTRGSDVYGPVQVTTTNRIGWFKCYVGDTNDGSGENNLYFNNLSIRTDNPLPVELANFDAKSTTSSINLYWTTLSEINNYGFNIEKSFNGINFETIGFVEGNGNSIEAIAYQFTDENPQNGLNYYRLKQIDFDGQFEYSNIISIDFENENSISFYPNPVSDNLIITTDIQDDVTVRLISVNGQVISENSQYIDNQFSIDVSRLNNGIYYLQVINKNSVILNELFVKE